MRRQGKNTHDTMWMISFIFYVSRLDDVFYIPYNRIGPIRRYMNGKTVPQQADRAVGGCPLSTWPMSGCDGITAEERDTRRLAMRKMPGLTWDALDEVYNRGRSWAGLTGFGLAGVPF
jgi:hypothetical protein